MSGELSESFMVSSDSPLVVEVTRGRLVESRHRGAAVVSDGEGAILARWGEVDRPVFARSAVKPIQALPLIETGAAEGFELGDAELALAAASHVAAPEHLAELERWMARIGVGVGDLECGVHPPLDAGTAAALAREGRAPSALHNNCSGQHLGFLATAIHEREPKRGYIGRDHPVQRRVRAVLSAYVGRDLGSASEAIDGCGIPTLALPLTALARAMARFARPEGLGPARAAAAGRLWAAIVNRPDMLAGSGRVNTQLIEAGRGGLIVKGGYEGVYLAALRARGIGVALKIEDGAKRAAEAAIAALLVRLGALTDGTPACVPAELLNCANRPVGSVRVRWPEPRA
ncbi:MAG: asparaginase [Alphaproteobacteria bacterium]